MNVSYDEVNEFVESLRAMEFSAVVGIYRGGLPLAVTLSHYFDVPLGIIKFQRLDGNDKVPTWLHKPDNIENCLVIDDIVDSGITLEHICDFMEYPFVFGSLVSNHSHKHIMKAFGHPKSELRGVVSGKYNPDKSDWVYFPWELKRS